MTSPFLTAPTNLCAARVTHTLSRVVGLDGSPFTLEEQFFKFAGERWTMDASFPPIVDDAIAQEWIAFLLKLEGMYGTFLMGPPGRSTPKGIGGGTPLVDGGGQLGNTLSIKGAPANTDGWLLRGDWYQLGSGTSSRMHKLTADVDTDSSGDAEMEFVSALRTAPLDGAAITISNPQGRFRLDSNETAWSEEPGGIVRIGFRAVEAL